MVRKIKQLFLFSTPTILVVVVFISLNHQNLVFADDSDSYSGTVKIEISDKNLTNYGSFSLPHFVLSDISRVPVLISKGVVTALDFLPSRCDYLCNINNLSPPTNFSA